MISSSGQDCEYIGDGFEANGIDSLSVVCRYRWCRPVDNRRDLQDEPVPLAIRRESVVPTVSVSASLAPVQSTATNGRHASALVLA
jgi:hypothetical protein